MKKEFIITSKEQYNKTMAKVFVLMNKGITDLTESEFDKIRQMVRAAERYEDEFLELRPNSKSAI